MKKLFYFLMVGLAFTALQVATVGAQTGQPGPPPTGEPMCFDPARGEIPCSEMSGAGDSGPPPSSMPPGMPHDGPPPGEHPPGEHHDGKGEHHEKDCSEIPEPAGRALCERTKAEGRPPTMEECAAMPTEEGRANCKEHAQ